MSGIFSYMGKYKKNIIIAVLLIFISIPFGVVPYFSISKLIDVYLSGSVTMNVIWFTAIIVFLGFAIKHLFYGLGLSQSHKGAFGTLYNLRVKLADSLMREPLGEIVEGGTGKYKKSFVEEIGRVELLLAHTIPEGLPNLFLPIIIFVVLMCIDWRMGLLSLASLPFGIIGMMIMMKSGMKKMPLYYQAGSKLNSAIVEYVSGMEVIKIFGQTTSSYKKYSDTVNSYKVFTLDWFKESWKAMSLTFAGMPCTVLLTLPIGAIFYMNGSLDLVTWILILMLNLSTSAPITRMVLFIPLVPQLSYTVKKLDELFNTKDVVSGDVKELPSNFDVEFDNITFAYKEKDVLRNVSFKAEQDKMTAIVGESGSGKSTLARLLVHYWDVKSGVVKIGGRDIREFTFDTLMSMTSYVAQDNFLFKGTIAENIRMGKLDATDEEVINAAKASACHEFITALPKGYETDVGDLGNKLSGGEKQRITIARAILKNAPIIILDEATAFTDAENEDLIQKAVENLTKNKTVIVIAHRLGTIVDADKTIVMKDGKLSASGTHKELLNSCPEYKKLWEMSQTAGEWNLAVKSGKEGK